MIRFLSIGFFVLLAGGCAGKKDDAKKDDDAKIVDKDEGPVKKTDRSDKKGQTEPKDDLKPPLAPPAMSRIKSVVIASAYRDDAKAAHDKYHDRLLEVTGLIEEIGINAVGDPYVLMAGQEIPVPRKLEFVMREKEPWSRVLPGQTATLKARCEILGDELRFKDGSVVEATGSERLPYSAADLAARFEKEAAVAAKELSGRWIELRGEIKSVDGEKEMAQTRWLLKTTGKPEIVCSFSGQTALGAGRWKADSKVRLVGKLGEYDAEKGIELTDCMPYAKAD